MRKLSHEEISARRLNRAEVGHVSRPPLYALLDNVRSLYNVGSIFRTADGVFLRKLYLCGYTPHPPRKEIEKTALGATETVPWEYSKNPQEVVRSLRDEGIKICVLEQTTESRPYFLLEKSAFPLCVVAGNEIAGVSPEVIAAADMAIEIPMYGTKQSLNVAVACGIALYELARIWRS